jgi:hypothetical protein
MAMMVLQLQWLGKVIIKARLNPRSPNLGTVIEQSQALLRRATERDALSL